MTFQPGDLVKLPTDYCPGCGEHLDLAVGLVLNTYPRKDVHQDLQDLHPAPYYAVQMHHEHNSRSGSLIYAERELAAFN